MATINNNGSELIENSPYSPDHTQSDFHLFSKLKKKPILNHTFGQMMMTYMQWLPSWTSPENHFFKSGIEVFKHHWKKLL